MMTGCQTDYWKRQVSRTVDSIDDGIDNLFSHVSSKRQNYNALQANGGFIIKPPYWGGDGFYLPVYADLSGASNVTHRPKDFNSDIAVKSVEAMRDENNSNRLYIYITTERSSSDRPETRSSAAYLGPLEPGIYTVEYLNHDETTVNLGGFEIIDPPAENL